MSRIFSRFERKQDDSVVHISHPVTNYEFFYEPFYASLDAAPPYDERFVGYGFTRNTQVTSDSPLEWQMMHRHETYVGRFMKCTCRVGSLKFCLPFSLFTGDSKNAEEGQVGERGKITITGSGLKISKTKFGIDTEKRLLQTNNSKNCQLKRSPVHLYKML